MLIGWKNWTVALALTDGLNDIVPLMLSRHVHARSWNHRTGTARLAAGRNSAAGTVALLNPGEGEDGQMNSAGARSA